MLFQDCQIVLTEFNTGSLKNPFECVAFIYVTSHYIFLYKKISL